MSLSGKIKSISCRIDLRALEPGSNCLIFHTIVSNGRTFYAAQRFYSKDILTALRGIVVSIGSRETHNLL